MKPGQAAQRLRQLRKNLSNTDAFFQLNQARWLEVLRNVTITHTLALRPDTADPEEWADFARDLSERILAAYEPNRASFQLAFRDLAENPEIEVGDIAREQVLDWVKAGIAGDPLGKHVLDHEFWTVNDAPEKIANGVYHIIQSGKSAAEWNTLREYIGSRVAQGTDDLLLQILSEWLAIMITVAGSDWRDWVREQVSNR